jgi:hypothetical protein
MARDRGFSNLSAARLLAVSLACACGLWASPPASARDPERPAGADPTPYETAAPPRVVPGRNGLAVDYAHSDTLTSAAAGDSRLVFVTQPLGRTVAVFDRFSGRQLGQLPAPPDGWLLPFSIRVPREGHVVVLDSGGFPNPSVPSVARVYDYDVRLDPATRRLDARLTRSVRFDGLPLVFAEDVEVIPGGLYVVSESIVGALWVIHSDGTIAPGLFPSTGVPIAALAPCLFLPTVVGDVPFAIAGNFGPGVVGLAERGGQLYFSSTCNGGVSRVPVASLLDATRDPFARADDIRSVSPRPPGIAETLHGLAFNHAGADGRWLYAADSLRLRVIRIDTRTGAREVVATDEVLFNFPSKLQFLPPVAGLAPLLVASDQEYRLPSINAAIAADITQPPWIVTKVYVAP